MNFPLFREPEDPTDDPEARIGVGDGATLSHGEAEDPARFTFPKKYIREHTSMNSKFAARKTQYIVFALAYQ